MSEMQRKSCNTLGYGFWYDIAKYGNSHWKGSFTTKEIAINAYNYVCEFKSCCMRNTPNETISTLCELLAADKTEEADDFLEMIRINSNFSKECMAKFKQEK